MKKFGSEINKPTNPWLRLQEGTRKTNAGNFPTGIFTGKSFGILQSRVADPEPDPDP
jgi:hypothetical protein